MLHSFEVVKVSRKSTATSVIGVKIRSVSHKRKIPVTQLSHTAVPSVVNKRRRASSTQLAVRQRLGGRKKLQQQLPLVHVTQHSKQHHAHALPHS